MKKCFPSLWIFFSGFLAGMANVIPGVSGGTLLLLTDVYESTLGHLAQFRVRPFFFPRTAWVFFAWIGAGAILGVVSFSGIVEFLMQRYPEATLFAFMGLVAGSVPAVFRRVPRGREHRAGVVLGFVLGFFGLLLLVFLSGGGPFSPQAGVVSGEFAGVLPFPAFFLAGFVGAMAMILPGVSGSMLLLVFGLYAPVIHAISTFQLFPLVFLALGIAAGILLMARFLRWLIQAWPAVVYPFLCGLVVASIVALFPAVSPQGLRWQTVFTWVLVFSAGFLAGTLLARKRKTTIQ
ncbi:MAG TPA: DUF368 domain-containing protein [Thermotogota bacterium]|nr:DUF368 domain-containing protein [Thermotogota bacterium]HRW91607.1 DUF368 domain-containing protein [Thermotogota bacterium]